VIRVLHIDDEAVIRLLCRVNLEPEGMEVIEAADGWTGVELAKREKPDLILLGVNLPGGTAPRVNLPPGTKPWFDATKPIGFQVAEELRNDQETREMPIVFLTARCKLEGRARGFDLGAVDYIPKPFDPTELAARLRGLLERIERGERDQLRREKISDLRARMKAENALSGEQRLSLAARRLFSTDEIVGWLLYAFGTVELVFAWPWPRGVGGAAIALGLIDHGRGVARAWKEADRGPSR
jgi:DNA-binding response OmpR family regulator